MERITVIADPAPQSASTGTLRITLASDDRYRRRGVLTTDCGKLFLLDLPEAAYLRHGTVLVSECDCRIEVRSAAEQLLEITAASALVLAKIIWHLGNRHTPAEITGDAIYIQHDHVLAEMTKKLGGIVKPALRAFEPERGAYGHTSMSQHSHTNRGGGA